MKIKNPKLKNGSEHLFGVFENETGTIQYVYEHLHQIPMAMGCYMEDFFKKEKKYKIVKFRIKDVETVTTPFEVKL